MSFYDAWVTLFWRLRLPWVQLSADSSKGPNADSIRSDAGNPPEAIWRPGGSAPQLPGQAIAELLELGQLRIVQIQLTTQVVGETALPDPLLQLATRLGQADALLALVLAGDGPGQPALALQPLDDGGQGARIQPGLLPYLLEADLVPRSERQHHQVLGVGDIQSVQQRPIGAVVEFAGQRVLIAVSRNGITRIADDSQGEFHAD